MTIVLGRQDYADRVYACWLGKNIGGTLGQPFEGKKFVNNLTFYDPVPQKPLPNDDLDLQLVWLKLLEEQSAPPSLGHFADYWLQYLPVYPWNEYGFCLRNLERGLRPPISGWFENYYVDEMGSPIRSEIWACIAPANPQRAASLAWLDSAMDHAGGEGMWGEMFWAAIESAAFVLNDPRQLIDIGLAMIPPSCNIARAIREVIWCWRNNKRWAETRDRIVVTFGNAQPCNAIQNHAFTVLGWLYGQDFGDRLCKAVNCGYDTDCTGATLGSVLGIIGGTAGIPAQWSKPVGDQIVLHKYTGQFNSPATVSELTERVIAVAERYVASSGDTVAFGEKTDLPVDLLGRLYRNTEAAAVQRNDIRAGVAFAGDIEVTLHYNGDPVFRTGVARRVEVSCRQSGESTSLPVAIDAPPGWQVSSVGQEPTNTFDITAADTEESHLLNIRVQKDGKELTTAFVVLGQNQAKGYPSGIMVPRCPTCRGRLGACGCKVVA